MSRRSPCLVPLLAIAASTGWSCTGPHARATETSDPPQLVVSIGQLRSQQLPVARRSRAWFGRSSANTHDENAAGQLFFIGVVEETSTPIEAAATGMPESLVPTLDDSAVYFLTPAGTNRSLHLFRPNVGIETVPGSQHVVAIGAHRNRLMVLSSVNGTAILSELPLTPTPNQPLALRPLANNLLEGRQIVRSFIEDDHVGFLTTGNDYLHFTANALVRWSPCSSFERALARSDHLLTVGPSQRLLFRIDSQGERPVLLDNQQVEGVVALTEGSNLVYVASDVVRKGEILELNNQVVQPIAPGRPTGVRALLSAGDLWAIAGTGVHRWSAGAWRACQYVAAAPTAPRMLRGRSGCVVLVDGDKNLIRFDGNGKEVARTATTADNPILDAWVDDTAVYLLTGTRSSGGDLVDAELYRW